MSPENPLRSLRKLAVAPPTRSSAVDVPTKCFPGWSCLWRASCPASTMMYLVFLSFVYVWHGGTFVGFVRLVLGYDEEEKPVRGLARLKHKLLRRTSNPAHFARGIGDGHAKDKDDPDMPLLHSAGLHKSSGGTFSMSTRLNADNDPEDMPGLSASMSLNRNFVGSTTTTHDIPGSSASMSLDERLAHPSSTADDGGDEASKSWFLSKEERDVLKRRTITGRLRPLVILSSFVSDVDLVTDWIFLYYVLVDFPVALWRAGLVFAIIGSIMWVLSTTEFALVSHLKLLWQGHNPMSRIEYTGLGWQLLLNVILEDLPQFIITVITKPTSISGALNIATSLFSLLSKIVKGISSTSSPSLATQFTMIDVNPAVTRHLFTLADEAKRKAKMAEKLVNLAWVYRCARGDAKRATVFQVLQLDPTFVDGDLAYMKVDLISGSRLVLSDHEVNGHIPPELGRFNLTNLILRRVFLSGTIPRELGHLRQLKELDLSSNELIGVIPRELTTLSALEVLILNDNALSGTIPPELGKLTSLEKLNLAGNFLSGSIPVELGRLAELTLLDLSRNRLVGCIPRELSSLYELESLKLQNNKLGGDIPLGLGSLERVRKFDVSNNRLSRGEWAQEELLVMLHPECRTAVLPQEEVKEEPEEEEEQEQEEVV